MSQACALVRGVTQSFSRAISALPPDPPIEVARARAQHAGYVVALSRLGLHIVDVAEDEACPDCCFIEDTAVVAGNVAVVTRPGAESRRGEVDAVARALSSRVEVLRMQAPATLDGGDCLRLGRTIYVGLSARTNAAGAEQLHKLTGCAVVPVSMPAGVLHLKSVCSPLDDDLVLVAEGTLPPGTFGRARVIEVPRAEAHAANAVAYGRSALVAADGLRTLELVAAAGFRVHPLDTSELRKADGALTCLSIIVA
jgi:dimethylargininase